MRAVIRIQELTIRILTLRCLRPEMHLSALRR